jgi:NAD-dependent DNA ligase
MTKRKKRNPFIGCTIVVTGKLENYTRDGINTKIASIGAIADSSFQKNPKRHTFGKDIIHKHLFAFDRKILYGMRDEGKGWIVSFDR